MQLGRPMRRVLVPILFLAVDGCAVTSWFTSTHSEFVPPEPEHLQARIAAEGDTGNGEVDHFAVLIGADTELRHRGNLSMAYQVLLEQGYKRENIYILDSEGDNPFFPLTDVTTRASIELLFKHLAQIIEPHDTLFIYVTGHGRKITAEEDKEGNKSMLGVSTLVLNPGEELSQDEFAVLLERLTPETGIAFFDQCYWGPFESPKLCNFVMITTSTKDDTSYGVSFPRAFWSAFRDRRHRDGPPSIFEAFKFAMVADRATTLGFNRPRISHGCVNPSDITLLGAAAPKIEPAAAGTPITRESPRSSRAQAEEKPPSDLQE
jgi:hypothetical protein